MMRFVTMKHKISSRLNGNVQNIPHLRLSTFAARLLNTNRKQTIRDSHPQPSQTVPGNVASTEYEKTKGGNQSP